MAKNAKIAIFSLIFIFICLLLLYFMDDVVGGVLNDGKCDYCSNSSVLKSDGTEYCRDCFSKYDGNFWN